MKTRKVDRPERILMDKPRRKRMGAGGGNDLHIAWTFAEPRPEGHSVDAPSEWLRKFRDELRHDSINSKDAQHLFASSWAAGLLIGSLYYWADAQAKGSPMHSCEKRRLKIEGRLRQRLKKQKNGFQEFLQQLKEFQRDPAVIAPEYNRMSALHNYIGRLEVARKTADDLWKFFGGRDEGGRPSERDYEAGRGIIDQLWELEVCDAACHKIMAAALVASGLTRPDRRWYDSIRDKYRN
jgi:hypothetical protein